MKFVETLNGTYINWNEVVEVYHKDEKFLLSLIKLADGTTYDLIDVPSTVLNKELKMVHFSYEELILWHKVIIEYIISSEEKVIQNAKMTDDTWDIYNEEMLEILTEREKCL